MASLFDPLTIGEIEASNRVFMAPMTRCRAGAGDVPQSASAEYYAQRAGAGLIITEATNISPMSCAFEKAPGVYSADQVAGWSRVTHDTHAAGGRIVCQLWHCGRVGASGILGGQEPMSPSGVNDDLDALQVWALLANGQYVRIAATPSRAMTTSEVQEIVKQYRTAAANSAKAGFDGVEVHAANGYLPHQFMSPTTNRRTDQYGGSVENRARFLREIIEGVAEVIPLTKVGVRLSPTAAYNNTRDPDPRETYSYVAAMLDEFGVAFIEIADTNAWAGAPDQAMLLDIIKPKFRGRLIMNGALTPESGAELVRSNAVDAVSYGRPFIANPDLPERIRLKRPIAEPRLIGWYGGSAEGYTDYPPLAPAEAA